ncbi:MAG: deoxyguanosinetriphosphate triphosphohydrolase [Kiritimatiellae bacterium]|nr:deoxyguanosinetriphosphate triphosphohydrolase [Kiritimatiellia bacterium]
MIHSREDRERLETSHLAPYAGHSRQSLGRARAEPRHEYRTEFQRDRDRIVHSRAFRRLEYKTQVFVNGTADHYRTRLTHTIEMAAVGRTIARALGANEDLTEAIALGHDIGHSPFGHSGEKTLDDLMRNEGGFDHNVQSLRAVELLEQRYPGIDGLNLTWEVRAGLRKHLAREPGAQLDGHPIGPYQQIEAQIADVADDITYHAHDVDDGLDAGLITDEQLLQLDLWAQARERAAKQAEGMAGERLVMATIRFVLDVQVEDVLRASGERLARHRPGSPAEVMACPERLVTFSPAMAATLEPFKAFLFRNVYWHPRVAGANDEAVAMMRKLFFYYVDHPETMGRKARARIEGHGLWRTVCDYIAGMTDRYAIEEFLKFGLDAGNPG